MQDTLHPSNFVIALALNREQKTWEKKKKKKKEFGSLGHTRFVIAIAKTTARETNSE